MSNQIIKGDLQIESVKSKITNFSAKILKRLSGLQVNLLIIYTAINRAR